MNVGVICVVPLMRVDHVTALDPMLDSDPPSVTILKTLKLAKPLNFGPRRSEPLRSAPHELLVARFSKLTDVTSRLSTVSAVLMLTRMMSVVCRKNGENWNDPRLPVRLPPSSIASV